MYLGLGGVCPQPPETCPEGNFVMRKIIAALLLAAGILAGTASAAYASPQPPTNGGNGAGQSGQCTGPADLRPASCQSP
jgi:hypothetical protein